LGSLGWYFYSSLLCEQVGDVMIATVRLVLAFLPAPIQVILLALIAIFVLLAVIRLIGIVLDAIPFL